MAGEKKMRVKLVKSVASEVTPLNEAVLCRRLARASRARERGRGSGFLGLQAFW